MKIHRFGISFVLAACLLPQPSRAADQGPSFDCAKVNPGSIEEIICKTPELAQDDREMAKLYQELMARLPENEKAKYRERQRMWLKERNNYFHDSEKPEYRMPPFYRSRIARLSLWLKRAKSGKDEAPLKLYRNDIYSFEFLYPADMQVITSTDPDNSVEVSYRPNGNGIEGKYPDVSLSITVKSGLTEESCFCVSENGAKNFSDYIRYVIGNQPKLNGFYVEPDNEDDAMGHGRIFQDYKTLRGGRCIRLEREMWWYRWNDPHEFQKDKATYDQADSEEHYEKMLDIVKSFRFLDSPSPTP